jgi:hypothetical protein
MMDSGFNVYQLALRQAGSPVGLRNTVEEGSLGECLCPCLDFLELQPRCKGG